MGHRVGQFIGHLTARVDPARSSERAPPAARCGVAALRGHAGRRPAPRARRRGAAGGRRRGRSGPAGRPRCSTTRPRAIACASGTASPASCCEAVAPRALRRLASSDPRSWRYPFHLYLHHAALSADAAAGRGLHPAHGGLHPRHRPRPMTLAGGRTSPAPTRHAERDARLEPIAIVSPGRRRGGPRRSHRRSQASRCSCPPSRARSPCCCS